MRMGHRKLLVLSLAVMMLGAMVWAPMAAAADTPAWVFGNVTGHGVNFSTPLSGAEVELWAGTPAAATGFTAITTPSGGYVINVLMQDANPTLPLYYTGANCFVRAVATNYVTGDSPPFTLESYKMWATDVDLTVLPSAFKGKAVKARNGRALKNVKVVVAGIKAYTAKTNAKGNFLITNCLLKPGVKVKVVFTKKGYRKVTKKVLTLPTSDPSVIRLVPTARMRKR